MKTNFSPTHNVRLYPFRHVFFVVSKNYNKRYTTCLSYSNHQSEALLFSVLAAHGQLGQLRRLVRNREKFRKSKNVAHQVKDKTYFVFKNVLA